MYSTAMTYCSQTRSRASFLWKGYHLEGQMGSLRLGLLIGYLLVLSHTLVVIVAYLMDALLQIHVRSVYIAESLYRSRLTCDML